MARSVFRGIFVGVSFIDLSILAIRYCNTIISQKEGKFRKTEDEQKKQGLAELFSEKSLERPWHAAVVNVTPFQKRKYGSLLGWMK